MKRRDFLALTALGSVSCLSPRFAVAKTLASAGPSDFDFVFFTDTHIQQELDAAKGCAMCFEKLSGHGADFAIQGGDHVFDALGVPVERSESLYDLYAQTEKRLGMPVHHVIGNHDVVGAYSKSGLAVTDPRQGKRTYVSRIGKTYYSWDHKGYHFIVLDSIQLTDDRNWQAGIDPAQLEWLSNDLKSIPNGMPVIVAVHCPITTGALAYSLHDMSKPPKYQQAFVNNACDVIPILTQHNVLVVLQGHIHINETVLYKGIPFVTCGAVSGDWWRGSHWETPEGYTVVSLRGGKATWRYETYGFKTISPRND
ncbi:metallophosphoesterase [Granulicella sp. dw_53]|uniref:metallophosphoesterase family protein n=1 Tax=Granulicella sp. dw_53 TaxID=2719792 RepID=UPI001BD233AE|nr:metallophosphoesterase [Granulicella sp. dw_53]